MTAPNTPKTVRWSYQPTAGNHDFLIYDEATGKDVALSRDNDEPRARLIASAPDLLATLEALRVDLTVGMVSDTLDLSRLCKDLARVAGAAIRKATQS